MCFGEVQRADELRIIQNHPETTMRKLGPATVRRPIGTRTRGISADEYIRRLDQLLVAASLTMVALAVSFFAQTM